MANIIQAVQRVQYYQHLLENMHHHDEVGPEHGLRDYLNLFEAESDKGFKLRYRFNKDTALYLCDMLSADLQRPTARSRAIPVHLQVLTALDFYANGAHQRLHGDNVHSQVSQASTCRIVKDVSVALASRRAEFIKFPSAPADVLATATEFYDYSRFPGIIGAIDGTHVNIQSPGGDNALYFVNRKGKSSINVQVVCNHSRVITNIVARWPGATHDSRIFTESRLKQKLEGMAMEDDNIWLVGDSGYACLPYLMTPLLNPVGQAQNRYNRALKRARNIVERVFGMLKHRLPCLNYLRVRLENVLAIIVACAVLWNISIAHRDEDFGGGVVNDDPGDRPHPGAAANAAARAGQLRRQRLIQEQFSN